jgi:hypothetical protein
MLKPFQIVRELIEFGLQALFLYILVILIFIGFMAYTLHSIDNPPDRAIYMRAPPETINTNLGLVPEMVCKRVAGCRIFKDGTIEW